MKRAIRLLCLVSLINATGAHWAFVQGVAWGGMFAGNLASSRMVTSLIKTFDRDRKCSVCIIVDKANESPLGEAAPPTGELRFDLAMTRTLASLEAPASARLRTLFVPAVAGTVRGGPPLRPPRKTA